MSPVHEVAHVFTQASSCLLQSTVECVGATETLLLSLTNIDLYSLLGTYILYYHGIYFPFVALLPSTIGLVVVDLGHCMVCIVRVTDEVVSLGLVVCLYPILLGGGQFLYKLP